MAKPSGSVFLLSGVPLDNKYEHTINFKSKDEQMAYFSSKIVKSYAYTSYIRKKDNILVDYHIDDIENVNYLYYRASSSSKYYFCFVTSKRYKSERVTELSIEIDVMQTYHFDYKLLTSFIERAHTKRWEADKSPVFSFVEEGLDYGKEYINEKAYNIKRNDEVIWFLCLMAHSKEFHEGITAPANLNDIPTPYVTYLIPHYLGKASQSFTIAGNKIANISEFMAFMGDSAIGSAVKEISYIPYLPINLSVNSSGVITNNEAKLVLNVDKIEASQSWLDSLFTDGASCNLLRINAEQSTYNDIITLLSVKRFAGVDMLSDDDWSSILANSKKAPYDKRIESKLMEYPYRYTLLTNWKSEPLILKNEYLKDEYIQIKMSKSLSFNNPARYWVSGYKDDKNGRGACIVDDNALDVPIISDSFYEYQLNNKNQMNANLVNGLLGAITGVGVGVATGGVGLALGVTAGTSQAKSIGSQIAKSSDIKAIPDSIINSNDSSLSMADKNLYLSLYKYKINDIDSSRIAQYWHMFGYKVNALGDVNEFINTRERFNYIKTIGANITGNFDNEDLATIKDIFNEGITFWHYYSGFEPLNYSYMNIEKDLL